MAHPDDTDRTAALLAASQEKIVEILLDHIRLGRSAFLVGTEGVGKTAILRVVADQARQIRDIRRPLYCGHASTLKELLLALAEELLVRDSTPSPSSPSARRPITGRQLSALSLETLRRRVLPRLSSGRYAVLLDHLGPIRGAYASFLEGLGERLGIPIVAAVRSLDPGQTGRLWWIGWKFPIVPVPELTPGEARLLVARRLDEAGLALPDREDFIGTLVRVAKGNPRVITRVCDLARAPRYRVGGRTDLRLLLLDLRLHDLQDLIEAENRIRLRGPVSL